MAWIKCYLHTLWFDKADILSLKGQKSHPALRGLMETSWQSGANLPYFIWPDETQFIKAILSSDSSIRSLTIWIIFHLYGNKKKDPPPSPLSLSLFPATVNCEGIFWQGWLSGLSHFKALSALGRRRVREISGLQQNSALQEPQLDLTWGSASIETECTMRCTEDCMCVSGRMHPHRIVAYVFKLSDKHPVLTNKVNAKVPLTGISSNNQ